MDEWPSASLKVIGVGANRSATYDSCQSTIVTTLSRKIFKTPFCFCCKLFDWDIHNDRLSSTCYERLNLW